MIVVFRAQARGSIGSIGSLEVALSFIILGGEVALSFTILDARRFISLGLWCLGSGRARGLPMGFIYLARDWTGVRVILEEDRSEKEQEDRLAYATRGIINARVVTRRGTRGLVYMCKRRVNSQIHSISSLRTHTVCKMYLTTPT